MKNNCIWIILICLFSIACTSNDVYFQYKTIDQKGWSKDSLCHFDFAITDTIANYNVYVNIRNKGEYPYQNLWLFLNKTTPDKVQVEDSIECYLADQRGKWLGSGIGDVHEMSVLYEQNVRFKNAGKYHYKIVHGMRDTLLTGINEIGLRIEKIIK